MGALKHIGRFSAKVAVAIAVVAGSAEVFNYVVQQRYVRPYVESNLETWIREQEKKLGFKYEGRPNIRYDDQNRNRLDIILDFNKFGLSFKDGGYYEPSNNTIHLPLNSDRINSIFSIGSTNIYLAAITHHELCHYYADKLSEDMGLGNFPKKEKDGKYNFEEWLLGEGIAEYCRIEMGFDYPSDYRHRLAYEMVKPIIKKHGAEGIKHMIRNPPKNLELPSDTVKYQRETLRALGDK